MAHRGSILLVDDEEKILKALGRGDLATNPDFKTNALRMATDAARAADGNNAGLHALIRPLSRRQPGLFDYSEANWIECEVEISAGAFQGTVRVDIRSEEFQAFLDEVEGMIGTLEGAASLTTMEGQLSVSIAIEGDDRMRVSGEVSDAAASGNRLRFTLEAERAQLPAIAKSLTYVLTVFPATGRVET